MNPICIYEERKCPKCGKTINGWVFTTMDIVVCGDCESEFCRELRPKLQDMIREFFNCKSE